jgi:hypothetical protein
MQGGSRSAQQGTDFRGTWHWQCFGLQTALKKEKSGAARADSTRPSGASVVACLARPDSAEATASSALRRLACPGPAARRALFWGSCCHGCAPAPRAAVWQCAVCCGLHTSTNTTPYHTHTKNLSTVRAHSRCLVLLGGW